MRRAETSQEDTGISGRARCHARGPHDTPPRTRCRISAPDRASMQAPVRLSRPGPLLGPGGQSVCMGALWRPRVLPYAEPGASAGGFERLLHEREGFEPETNGQLVSATKRSMGAAKIRFLRAPGGRWWRFDLRSALTRRPESSD